MIPERKSPAPGNIPENETGTIIPDNQRPQKKSIIINQDIFIPNHETNELFIADALSSLSQESSLEEAIVDASIVAIDIPYEETPINEECDDDTPREMLQKIDPVDFNNVGHLLTNAFSEGARPIDEVISDLTEQGDELSESQIKTMVSAYVRAGLLDRTPTGKLKLSKRGKDAQNLNFGTLRSAVIAHSAMTPETGLGSIDSFKHIAESYSDDREDSVDKIELEGDGNRMLVLSEVLIGNNATDVKFLEQVIRIAHNLPEEKKPNVVVLSGLLEGSHKFRTKDKRIGLKQTLDQQFNSAKVIIDELKKLDVPIIYVMSNDDREVCKDGTIEAMRTMSHLEKPLSDTDKGFLNYHRLDALKQNEAWDQHLRFQLDVVFEYCLRSGRRLRSADEMGEMFGENYRVEEYLLLWEAYQQLSLGLEVPEDIADVVNTENISFADKKTNGLIVTDGVDLTMVTKNGRKKESVTHMIRDSLNFGDKAMYANPTKVAETTIGQINAMGGVTPDVVTILDQQQVFGVGKRGTWITSAGGMIDAEKALDQKTGIANSGRPAAWRHLTTRKTVAKPAAVITEANKDRFAVSFLNERLLDKADASPDRTAVISFNDWQLGSTSARPDLQAKYTDYVFTKVLPEGPMWLMSDGDIIDGWNHPKHPQEAAPIKLIRIEDQLIFAAELIRRATDHIPSADFDNLVKVGIVPGNHEWNSSYKFTGTAFTSAIASIYREMFLRHGIDINWANKDRVQAYEKIVTEHGDHLSSWTAIEKDVAGYGMLMQHLLSEGGGLTKPPVYKLKDIFASLGELAEDLDFGRAGHYHNPQYVLEGNKFGHVDPSLAGLTGYELSKSLMPVMGASIIRLGGGLPPEIEVLSKEFFDKYKIENGYFSDKELRERGIRNDRNLDEAKHGFLQRKSALSKGLWNMTEEIVDSPDSIL